MTINKSQGQNMQRVGLYLPCDVFSQGMGSSAAVCGSVQGGSSGQDHCVVKAAQGPTQSRVDFREECCVLVVDTVHSC